MTVLEESATENLRTKTSEEGSLSKKENKAFEGLLEESGIKKPVESVIDSVKNFEEKNDIIETKKSQSEKNFQSFTKESSTPTAAISFLESKIKNLEAPINLFSKEVLGNKKPKIGNIENDLPQYFFPSLKESAQKSDEIFWKQWKVFSQMEHDIKSTKKDVQNLDLKSIGKNLSDRYPVFVKILQSVGNLLKDSNSKKGSIVQPLISLLQKDLPQRISAENIKKSLDDSEKLFDSFEEKPLGIGTIGQVNKVLVEGKEKVVKIKKTDIDEKFKNNKESISVLLNALKKYFETKVLDPVQQKENAEILHMIEIHWDYFVNIFSEELDFDKEKENIEKMHHIFKNTSGIISPNLDKNLSQENAIVMDFVAGKNVDDVVDELSEGDKKKVRRRLLKAVRIMRKNNLFHGDMHKGNFVITDKKEVGLLDLGTVTDKVRKRDIFKIIWFNRALKKNKSSKTILQRYLRMCNAKVSKNQQTEIIQFLDGLKSSNQSSDEIFPNLYKKLAVDYGVFPPEKYLKTIKSLLGLAGTLKPLYGSEKKDSNISVLMDYFVWSRFV